MSQISEKVDKHAKSRESLREIQQLFEQAVQHNTIEEIREHTDDEFSFVSFTDQSFSNFDAFLKQWNLSRASMIGNGSFTTNLNPETSLFEGNIAICKGNARNKMINNEGKIFEYNSHWTVVFKQTNGVWKILRAHNSLDPFTNPMLLSHVKGRVIKASILALLLGGLIGATLIYFLTQ